MPRYALLILAIASLLWGALAFASPGSSTLDVAAIRPGMKGYGLTVFRGVQPERFDVEVIDVLHNFRPNQDLIVIRTPHPILNQATTVAGMSGSPIYLDGKLAGAYAYGWQFGKEPVAGVTPISNMLAELWRPLDPAIFRALGTLPGGPLESAKPHKPQTSSGAANSHDRRRTELRGRVAPRRAPGVAPYLGQPEGAFDALRAHAEQHASAWSGDARGTTLQPAATPLMLGGMDEQVVEMLSAELERFGIFGVQAGGAGAKPTKAAAAHAAVASPGYVDGGAIAVDLVRGDISMTGIGTVTHVDGQRLVAFGHPMMGAGQTSLPTSTARVVHILASGMRSFKIAERLDALGTLIHDRQAAIVIDAGLTADTVPVRVRVKGPVQAPKTEWNMEVVGQRQLTPALGFAAVFNAVRATAPEQSDVSFRATSRVKIEGHDEIEVTDEGFTGAGMAHPLALSQIRLFQLIGAAYGNPFEDVRVERIEVDLELKFENHVLTLVDAQVASREVDPGSNVDVYLTLRAFNGDEQVRVLPVYVPASAAGDKLEIELAPGYQVRPEQPKPTSVKQILEAVQMAYAADSLIVSTKLPNQSLRMRGHVVRSLPGSMLDTLQMQSAADKPQPFVTYDRKEVPLGELMVGQAKLQLDVRREKK